MVTTQFLLSDIEQFILVFARITSFMFVAPFFANQGVPAPTKIGISGIVSLMIVQVVNPEIAAYESAIGYGLVAIKEILCGLILGFACNICFYIITTAGNLIDMDMGLAMASQFDPSLNTQTTITGNLYYYFMLLMLLLTRMHEFVLRAIMDSFSLMSLGGQEIKVDSLLNAIVAFLTNLFILAFRIMLPIFATMLIVNVVLGIMAKVAPQMNMFSVGIQIKLMTGVIVLFVMVFLFPEVVSMVSQQIRINLANFAEGLY